MPIGLATKRWPIPGAEWVKASVGGALYVVFFSLLALAALPRTRAWILAGSVLAWTCAVETLQLWHPAWLDAIRDTRPGALVLGSTFSWSDFPWYFAGAALAWPWLWLLQKLCARGASPITARGAPRRSSHARSRSSCAGRSRSRRGRRPRRS